MSMSTGGLACDSNGGLSCGALPDGANVVKGVTGGRLGFLVHIAEEDVVVPGSRRRKCKHPDIIVSLSFHKIKGLCGSSAT